MLMIEKEDVVPNHSKYDWKRMCFKGNKVWVQTNNDGIPLTENGKALIKYQLEQEHEYRVLTGNLTDVDQCDKQKRALKKRPAKKKTQPDTIPDNAVLIYTDGASSGNPGPSGIGVFLKFQEHEKEIALSIGNATNNIAELTAIKTGLLEVKKKDLPVRVFTDSNYAYGLLELGWVPKKNKALVGEIRQIMTGFKDLKVIKVKGHAGDEYNERADKLATSAIV